VEHQLGEVHVEDVTGDIDVRVLRGQVTLRLPQDGRYAIDARPISAPSIRIFPVSPGDGLG